MRVLIVRLSALGDVVCTLPVAMALKRLEEDVEVVWLADKRFAGIAYCCEGVDEVVVCEKGLGAIKEQVAGLGEFDLALDMQGLMKSAMPVTFAKAERKLAYHWQREGAGLLVGKVLPDADSIHVVDQYMDVARSVGCDEKVEFGLLAKDEDLEKVRGVLREAGWSGGKLVVANAGAGWAAKRWAPENFAHVSRQVAKDGAQMVFLGTEADRGAFSEVVDAGADGVLDLLGKTNVRELVALVELGNVILAGDTGALHVGAGLGKWCVGVYTQTSPERSGAYGQLDRCKSVDVGEVTRMVLEGLL